MIRFSDYISEAETGTKNAKQIASTLKKAGYKKLGSGADATVWSKEESSVIKIIMPEDGEDADSATKTFIKFYEFCQQHKDIKCLPKFVEIQGSGYSSFELGGKEYLQISMEKLRPLKRNTFEEMMVWILSDFATKDVQWEDVKREIADPSTWGFRNGKWIWAGFFKKMPDMLKDRIGEASFDKEYKILFMVMRLLYVTGRINKVGWDLHTENVMQRSDGTLVIVDPWFNAEAN